MSKRAGKRASVRGACAEHGALAVREARLLGERLDRVPPRLDTVVTEPWRLMAGGWGEELHLEELEAGIGDGFMEKRRLGHPNRDRACSLPTSRVDLSGGPARARPQRRFTSDGLGPRLTRSGLSGSSDGREPGVVGGDRNIVSQKAQ